MLRKVPREKRQEVVHGKNLRCDTVDLDDDEGALAIIDQTKLPNMVEMLHLTKPGQHGLEGLEKRPPRYIFLSAATASRQTGTPPTV